MYADDNNGVFPRNCNTGDQTINSWVLGILREPQHDRQYQRLNLMNSLIGPYCARQLDIDHCPADNYTCIEWGQQMRRVRSISMNCYVNGYSGDATPVSGWSIYRKESDMTNPKPSDLWVFVDEHPDSINDGWLIISWQMANVWSDLPASYHNGACGFGFADGHAEIHKWHEGAALAARDQGDLYTEAWPPASLTSFGRSNTPPPRHHSERTRRSDYSFLRAVCEEASQWLGEELPRAWLVRLTERAEAVYASNARVPRWLRGRRQRGMRLALGLYLPLAGCLNLETTSRALQPFAGQMTE